MSYEYINPPYEALTTDPMSPEEIDKHADAAKIWATIVFVQEHSYDEGYDEGYWQGREHSC